MLKISKSNGVTYKKRYFQIKLMNYEGVIILSTGEIFATNAHRSNFMLSAYFYLHPVLDKIPMWKLFTLTLMEKVKSRKKSLG